MGAAPQRAIGEQVLPGSAAAGRAAGAGAARTRAALEGEGSLLVDKSRARMDAGGVGRGPLVTGGRARDRSLSAAPQNLCFSALEEQVQVKDHGLLVDSSLTPRSWYS